MKVSNMLFDLAAPTEGSDEQSTSPAFLPSSGASSMYLDSIAPNGTADISIELNAKADLLQKPYSMDLSMKYEDPNATQVEGSSSISIPVKQDARFEFSDFEISPQSVAVGEEANVMCSLYNLGRIKLYNVKATFFITAHYLNSATEEVEKMVNDGHIIGNHTVNHKSMPLINNETIEKEIMQLHQSMYEKFGYEMKYLRPPKGEFNERTLQKTSSSDLEMKSNVELQASILEIVDVFYEFCLLYTSPSPRD